MGLDLEYFKDQKHINDLQKLNDKELKFIIRLLQEELEAFNKNDDFKTKGIIKACNETFDLFKNFRFILSGYIDVIEENDLSYCDKKTTEELLNKIVSIVNNLKSIGLIKKSKDRLNELAENSILNIRLFYDSMNKYILDEYYLWEALKSREERINKHERYINQDKFNTQE